MKFVPVNIRKRPACNAISKNPTLGNSCNLRARKQKQLRRPRFRVHFHDNESRAPERCMFDMKRVLMRAQINFQARRDNL